jgi:hypothetical protein
MIETLLLYSLAAYSITFVVASSSLFEPLRERIKKVTPWLKIGNHKHMIDCRMCFGFYAALLVCNTDWKMVLPVYGLSYFMATLER